MMRTIRSGILICLLSLLVSCAYRYQRINPESLNYISKSKDSGIDMEYKYAYLHKKYGKKLNKKGIKILAVKVTNNTDKELSFGSDIKLVYESGNDVNLRYGRARLKADASFELTESARRSSQKLIERLILDKLL